MIKKVEAAHRQDNSEGTEHIPVKIRKAGQTWAKDITIRMQVTRKQVRKMVGKNKQ